MSIANLFLFNYWFGQPMTLTKAGLAAWLVIFLALIGLGLVSLFIRVRSKEQALRNFLNRVAGMSLTMGLFGLLWMFFRQQSVPFLAWRFWFAIWIAVTVVWAAPLIKYFVKRLPAVRAENAARMEKEKYLKG